jgi:hypothetical protein
MSYNHGSIIIVKVVEITFRFTGSGLYYRGHNSITHGNSDGADVMYKAKKFELKISLEKKIILTSIDQTLLFSELMNH